MKSIKQIILESLRYFRELLLKDEPIQNDTKHAFSCAGAYNLQNMIMRSVTRSGLIFTVKNANGDAIFTFNQQDSNTTYSVNTNTGLASNGTTFYLPNISGLTAGTYGPSGNVTGSNGVTINVPQITVNAQGKVTAITNRTYKSVNTDTNTTYSDATTSAHGLMSAADKTNLNNVVGWINRGQFTGNIDSTSITPGVYRLNASNSYTHNSLKINPPEWCLFIQFPTYNTQIIIDGGATPFIWWRDHTGNPAKWGTWKLVGADPN